MTQQSSALCCSSSQLVYNANRGFYTSYDLKKSTCLKYGSDGVGGDVRISSMYFSSVKEPLVTRKKSHSDPLSLPFPLPLEGMRRKVASNESRTPSFLLGSLCSVRLSIKYFLHNL